MALSVFRPTGPADLPSLTEFLCRYLKLLPSHPGLTAAAAEWKYWCSHPDWEGSRSYILERGGRIDAHCAVLPVRYVLRGQRRRAIHFIDWAADSTAFGAGVKILRKVASLVDLTYAVGGSADTRKILPLMGFTAGGEVSSFALPVRPLRQLWHHQKRDWRLPFRFGRNLLFSVRAARSVPDGWTVKTTTPDQVPEYLWHIPESDTLTRQSSPALAAWFLKSPIMPTCMCVGSWRGEPRAAWLLSFFPAQARIVDLWGLPELPYETIYRLALVTAIRNPDVCEVTASASTQQRRLALQQCGFQFIQSRPPMACPAPVTATDFQDLDNDACFLRPAKPFFMT